MIFLDTNIFVYAAGTEHAHKDPSRRLVLQIAAGDVQATTSTEVLQEILHRYRAIRRWRDGRAVYDRVREMLTNIVPITSTTTDRARELMDTYPALTARDALHVATCESLGAEICSYDSDFDSIREIRRCTPDQIV